MLALFAYRLHARLRAVDRRHRREVEEYLDIAGAMLIVLDRDARVVTTNRKAREVLGRSQSELTGADWFATVAGQSDREASRRSFERIVDGSSPRGRRERSVRRPDGTERFVEWEFATRCGDDGSVTNVLASGQDITDRRAAELQLAGLRRLAQDVASHDDARQLVVQHACELLGASSVALVQSGQVTAHHPDAEAPAADTVRAAVVRDGVTVAELAVTWADAGLSANAARATLLEILAQEMATALGRLELLHSLEQKAVRDVLTGVPNRRALDEELPRALARAARTGAPLSVAALDLNAFKTLNDTEGHEAGDRALKECSAAWVDALRTTDTLVRLGGDEFVALLPDCPQYRAVQVARRLREATPHAGGCSVGVVCWSDTETGDDLLRRADQALYADKARSRASRLTDPQRLAAVARTGLTNGEGDTELDEITRVARWLLDVPAASVTLMEADRHVFASQSGLSPQLEAAGGMPVATSFCRHAVVTGDPLVINDSRHDARVRGNSAIEEHGLIAYAGIPLRDGDGNVLGALCAVDGQPREWSESDIDALGRLADRVAERLAQRIDGIPQPSHSP